MTNRNPSRTLAGWTRAALVATGTLAAVTAVISCGDDDGDGSDDYDETMSVTSPAFGDGETIPIRHTCDGEEISPPLFIADAPPESVSLALVADDPDAPGGTCNHWLLWGMPPDQGALPEGVPDGGHPMGDLVQGTNDAGDIGYFGPCPPEGEEHRYFFRVYAIDIALSLEAGADRDALDAAMEGHVIGYGDLMGRYERPD